MASISSITSYHSLRNLYRIFPLRVKYLAFSPKFTSQFVRPLSTRPIRSATALNGGFRRDRGEVRASKSLIEDEAELSDWVSDLKTSSFRGRFSSEDESESDKRGKNERDRDGGRSRGRDGDREGVSMKRRRDSDNFGDLKRRNGRGQLDSFSRNSRFDGQEGTFNSHRGRGRSEMRGRGGSGRGQGDSFSSEIIFILFCRLLRVRILQS